MDVETKFRFIDPAEYPSAPVPELLDAAAKGHAALDQRFVHAIVDRGPEVVPDLMRFALADRSNDPVNLEEDLIAIFRHLKADALPFYVRCVRENPEDVTDELIDAIVPFGQEALDPLLKLYGELGEEQGGDTAFLLAALGVKDQRILDLLIDRLEYNTEEAALALSVYRDPAAIPALEKFLAEIPETDVGLRRELQMAIDTAGVARDDAEVEAEPFDIWDMYPESSTPPLEMLSEGELLEMLSSSSAEYRSEAALSFRNRSEYSSAVRDRLVEIARKDPDLNVRGRAWEALGEKAEEPSIRKALKAALADEKLDFKERTGALVGLSGSTDDAKVVSFIRQFYDNPATRAKSLEAMWRSFDKQFVNFFPKHLNDADPDVRRAAIWGVGYLGSGSLAGDLEKMFEEEEFRADALFAYALNVPSEISHGRVPGLFRKINEAAGGLSYGEAELVQAALDQRLVMHGLDPYFATADPEDDGADWDEKAEAVAAPAEKPGRNDACPCGSGKKYKKCHGA